jgi:hypothetical protein
MNKLPKEIFKEFVQDIIAISESLTTQQAIIQRKPRK